MSFKHIYLLLLLGNTTSLSEISAEEAKLEMDFGLVVAKDVLDTHMVVRSHGIFKHFVMELLNLLTNGYSSRMLKHYVKVLGKELDKLEYRLSKKLAKYLISLSKEPRDVVQSDLQELRDEFFRDDGLPRRSDFFNAINPVYTLRENVLFRNYVLEVKDYVNELIPFIGEQTNKIINDAILNPMLKMSFKDRQDLEKKLNAAYREYMHGGRFQFAV